MSEAELETARLLARFKLQVRRSLDRSVNLAAMTESPDYAADMLARVEELADDEELLLLVIRLRERLTAARPTVPPPPPPLTSEPVRPSRMGLRDYRFGARGG